MQRYIYYYIVIMVSLKMYVRDDDILTDFSSGMVCVLASSVEEARNIAIKTIPYLCSRDIDKIMSDNYKVYDKPSCVFLYWWG